MLWEPQSERLTSTELTKLYSRQRPQLHTRERGIDQERRIHCGSVAAGYIVSPPDLTGRDRRRYNGRLVPWDQWYGKPDLQGENEKEVRPIWKFRSFQPTNTLIKTLDIEETDAVNKQYTLGNGLKLSSRHLVKDETFQVYVQALNPGATH